MSELDAPALFEAIDASRAALRRRMAWAAGVRGVEDCRDFIARLGTKPVFAITQEGGALIGIAALSVQAPQPLAEVSGWIAARHQKRGCAAAAGKKLVEAAFKILKLERLYARIDPANRAGRKVIQGLGFKYEGRLRREKRLNGRWIDQECWGLLKNEWKKNRR